MGKDNFTETIIIKEADDSDLKLEKFDYGEIAENIIKDKINAYVDAPNVLRDLPDATVETITQPSSGYDSDNAGPAAHNVAGPFSEIFEPKDIINRTRSSDYIVDDLLKRKQEQEKLEKSKQHFYISKVELDSIINDNPRMQMFKKNDNNELEEVNAASLLQVLLANLKSSDKKDLIELTIPTNPDQPVTPTPAPPPSTTDSVANNSDDEYITPHAFSDDDEDVYYMSEEDAEAKLQKERMEMTLKSVQDVIDKLTEEEKYLPPDELFREFLQENFKDFLLAKKISGNNKSRFSDKIVPKENVKDDNQTIEISDLNKSQLIKAGERTSILINREEDFNIESIEVLCKCGEKTIIRFAELSEDEKATDSRVENKSYTDVVLDAIDVTPMTSDTSIEDEYANFDADLSDNELQEMQDMGAEYD